MYILSSQLTAVHDRGGFRSHVVIRCHRTTINPSGRETQSRLQKTDFQLASGMEQRAATMDARLTLEKRRWLLRDDPVSSVNVYERESGKKLTDERDDFVWYIF
jgi:hypothetical protein